MRKLNILSFVSLDGVMQAPGGPEEDLSGGFEYGGWVAGYWDAFLETVMSEQTGRPFELLLGRKTYDIFAAYWPRAKEDAFADTLNNARKYVVSTTLKKLDWNNSRLIQGDVVEEIRKLKEQNGPELQVHGSSGLIQTLLKHDLADGLLLKIFPVTLGKGKRLFGEGALPASFRLLDAKTSTTGVIVASYEREGEIKTGSFDLENQKRETPQPVK